MILTDDIVNRVKQNPKLIVPFSTQGRSCREIIQLAQYRPSVLEEYLETSIENALSRKESEKYSRYGIEVDLNKLVIQNEILTRPEAMLALIRTAERHIPEAVPGMLTQIIGCCFSSGYFDKVRPTFVAVCGMEGMTKRRDLTKEPNSSFGILDRVFGWAGLYHRRFNGDWDHTEGQEIELIISDMSAQILENGGELDAAKSFQYNGNMVQCQSILHELCIYENDLDNHGRHDPRISILIKCGANWRKVLESEQIQESAKRAIMNHPLVRKELLCEAMENNGDSRIPEIHTPKKPHI